MKWRTLVSLAVLLNSSQALAADGTSLLQRLKRQLYDYAPPCTSNEFRCRDGTCIDRCYVCDTARDCPFGGDEEPDYGCLSEDDCPRFHFRCDGARCLPREKICDGVVDCYDGYDEEKCKTPPRPTPPPTTRRTTTWRPPTTTTRRPTPPPCYPPNFTCDYGLCVDARRRCDGYPDCRDGADESGCPTSPPAPEPSPSWPCDCRDDQFKCGDGSCIDGAGRCNGIVDCADVSDELNCPCRYYELTCDGNRCVSLDRRCDGYPDCRDGTDEFNCTRPTPPPTRPTPPPTRPTPPPCRGFICDGGRCLTPSQRCDGRADCRDGSDEAGCGCTPGQFRCNSGECIDECYTCDGNQDCADNSDEDEQFGCRRLPACADGQIRCVADGSCVPREARCDGRSDCPDGQDEYLCPDVLPPGVVV